MIFLSTGHVAGKIVKDTHTRYLIWDEHIGSTSIDDGSNISPGIEVVVVDPKTTYIYDYEFPSYTKFIDAPPLVHMHGICNVGVIDNQLPMFHVYQTNPYWRRMFSSVNFDHYIMSLVGVSLLDYRHRFGMGISLDSSQSKSVKKLSELYEKANISPPPTKVEINSEDEGHDSYSWVVRFKLDEVIYIEENYLYMGDQCSRYEIDNAISGKKDSPRFWNQHIKDVDLIETVCDNQMVLF